MLQHQGENCLYKQLVMPGLSVKAALGSWLNDKVTAVGACQVQVCEQGQERQQMPGSSFNLFLDKDTGQCGQDRNSGWSR